MRVSWFTHFMVWYGMVSKYISTMQCKKAKRSKSSINCQSLLINIQIMKLFFFHLQEHLINSKNNSSQTRRKTKYFYWQLLHRPSPGSTTCNFEEVVELVLPSLPFHCDWLTWVVSYDAQQHTEGVAVSILKYEYVFFCKNHQHIILHFLSNNGDR